MAQDQAAYTAERQDKEGGCGQQNLGSGIALFAKKLMKMDILVKWLVLQSSLLMSSGRLTREAKSKKPGENAVG